MGNGNRKYNETIYSRPNMSKMTYHARCVSIGLHLSGKFLCLLQKDSSEYLFVDDIHTIIIPDLYRGLQSISFAKKAMIREEWISYAIGATLCSFLHS